MYAHFMPCDQHRDEISEESELQNTSSTLTLQYTCTCFTHNFSGEASCYLTVKKPQVGCGSNNPFYSVKKKVGGKKHHTLQ